MPDLNKKLQGDIDSISRISIVETLLEVICRTTGMGFAVIARVTDKQWVACAVRDEISFGLKPGGQLDLETTLCHEVDLRQEAIVIDHVAADEHYNGHPSPAMYGYQSYISMPITLRNGTFFGTLCCIDPNPAQLKNPQIIGMFKLYAELISFHLDANEQLAFKEKMLLAEQGTVQELNYEIFAVNEELTAANEELIALNNDLVQAQQDLQELNEDLELQIIKRTKELAESEKLFRLMAEGTDILIAVGDDSSNAIYFNKAWTDFTGRPLAELINFGWADLVHPDDKEKYLAVYLSAFEQRVPFTGEFRILNKQGDYRWLLATGPPRFNDDGLFAGYISSCVDITVHKLDDQRKNDFIAMVSHELKTPLTSMKAYIQMLLGKAKKTDDIFTAGALEKTNIQVRKMTTMINGFLNVSRLESGRMAIDRQHFDLKDLIADVETEAIDTISSHRVIFHPVTTTYVDADRDKIGQVINNFISNAIKYSPGGSTIQVACQTVDGQAQVSVQDEGMGINAAEINKLFDRFYRVQSNSTKNISGFGIGLYLCMEIIQRHKGEIWVDSEINQGSTFYFSLPLAG